MNNNSNGKGKESDIITKKGFLISLPGKKKDSSDTGSSINLAKPQNDQSKNDSSKSEAGKDKKNFNKKHDNRHDKNNKKHGGKDTANQNNQDKDKNKNENRHAETNNVKKENKVNPQKQEKNRDNDKHRDNRDKSHRHGDKKNKSIGGNQPVEAKPEKQEKNDPGEKRDNKDSRNNRHGKNRHDRDRDRNNNNNNNNNNDRSEKKSKLSPLSSLSGDIAKEIKMHSDASDAGSFVKELSLEEKYKNAKPLADQIAEQEMRQKGIKIPYDNEKKAEEAEKQEIVGIRFREAGKIYYFDPAGMKVPFGAPVIVETARGSEYGFTAISNRMIPVESLTAPLKKIERLATPMDTQKHEANKNLEKDAEKVFLEKVEKLGLAMNLIYVEYTFDNSRLLFYFTAETRIDFRELVKELASVFRTRIELRQIGVRDEAKVLGGLGVCGRATCCNTFLGDFAQVSIKMAKDQSLSLNAAKISGACGKLMCCLRYEDKVYEEENARTPKVGSIVETAEGRGHVVERNALKGIVSVQLDLTPEAPAKPFPREEVMVIGFNKDKSDDDIDSEELKSLQDS